MQDVSAGQSLSDQVMMLLNGCVAGNPLSEDIYFLHQEPEGTRKVLNYLLDSLPGN